MKNTSLSQLFYLRKDKKNNKGEVPIYLRITVDGKRSALSTNRYIQEAKWNSEAGRAKGNKEDIKELNSYLDTIKSAVLKNQSDMFAKGKAITSESLKNAVLGKGSHRYTVLEAFEHHNSQMKEKEGTQFAKATVLRYATTIKHLKDFMMLVYKRSDMFLNELDNKFICDLEHYFKTKKKGKCNHNSSLKYIRNFRKIIHMAVANDWLEKDPFMLYKGRLEDSKRTYLDTDELKLIENLELSIERLSVVRDIFIFCCYTGLAYVDVEKLRHSNLYTDKNGKKWIHTFRQKTESRSNIPLLPNAKAILDKYSTHPECLDSKKLLPVKSNQKMNAYLKEIATLCDIPKDLTMHVARHTFSTTVALTNDLPIETLSKILGHKSIRTTQIYGRIIDKKVGKDMDEVERKLTENVPFG